MESNNIGNEYISYTGNICSFIRDYDNDKIRTLSIDELMNNITPLKKTAYTTTNAIQSACCFNDLSKNQKYIICLADNGLILCTCDYNDEVIEYLKKANITVKDNIVSAKLHHSFIVIIDNIAMILSTYCYRNNDYIVLLSAPPYDNKEQANNVILHMYETCQYYDQIIYKSIRNLINMH